MLRRAAAAVGCVVTMAFATAAESPMAATAVRLSPCQVEGIADRNLRCGVHHVFENRTTRKGLRLPLEIVVIPARHSHPEQGPVFALLGGPGETATEAASYMIDAGANDEHDVVLVDQRGTGDGHRLDCPTAFSGDDLQAYLDFSSNPDAARLFHDCSRQLEQRFDLSQYTTSAFVEDLDEVRQVMGYDRINIWAGSFGTYAAQMYIRRYGAHVRSAYLTSLVTLSNRVPLYHAWGAQHALDQLFNECERDVDCSATYPRLREDFAAVLSRLREAPVPVSMRHPVTNKEAELHLTEPAFADALRVLMYSSTTARQVPLLIERALAGDFTRFSQAGVNAVRNMLRDIRMGLHFAITCNEFVSRIRPEEVQQATQGSYFGSWRVETQMAICDQWPRTVLPEDFFDSFLADVPAVLVSGSTDPASPPRWGEAVRSFMPQAIHVVVPGGGHIPDNPCTRSIRSRLFRTGASSNLDLGCVSELHPAPFKLAARRTRT